MAGSLWPAPERITRKPMRGSSHAICHCVGLRTQHAKGCRRAVSRWRLSNEQTSPFAPAPKEGSLQPFGMHVCYRNVEITYLFSRPGVTEPKGTKHAEAVLCSWSRKSVARMACGAGSWQKGPRTPT